MRLVLWIFELKYHWNLFLKHLKFDKKVKEKKIRFILISDIGKVKVYKLNEEKILLDFLKKEVF